MNLYNKRILITQPILHEFSGSVVVTFELADYLQKVGAKVYVYSYTINDSVLSEFTKRNIKVFFEKPDLNLNLFDFDFIWIHSQVLPECLVMQLSLISDNWKNAPYFLFLHMSSLDTIPSEFQWIYKFEDTIADKVLYISEKVEQTHINLMEENIPFEYYRNPAPLEYISKEKDRGRLEKILIVSNHVPDEVEHATVILRARGIIVDYLGLNREQYHLISPEDIQSYDAVITIGKTVQYCILSQTPVYIYDRFGGPGYLQSNNYIQSKQWHFSGRGFEKKTSELIASEIESSWNMACEEISKIVGAESNQYRIDKVLERVLGDLTKREKRKISKAQELSILYSQRLQRQYFIEAYSHYSDNKKLLQNNRNILNAIYSSASYRLGNFLIQPFHGIKVIINKALEFLNRR